MLKKLFIALLLLTCSIKAMEQDISGIFWEQLPDELKCHILSFVVASDNLKDLASLSGTSKDMHRLVIPAHLQKLSQVCLADQRKAKQLLIKAAKNGIITMVKALINTKVPICAKGFLTLDDPLVWDTSVCQYAQ